MKRLKFLILLIISTICFNSCNYSPDITDINAATVEQQSSSEQKITSKYKLDIDKLRITNTQNPNFYFITTNSITENNSYYSLNISYPNFSNKELDEKTQNILNKYLDSYINIVNSEELEEKSYFSFCYTTVQNSDLLTINFFIELNTSEFSSYEENFTINLKDFYSDFELEQEKETIKFKIEEPTTEVATENFTEKNNEIIESTDIIQNEKNQQNSELDNNVVSTEEIENIIINSSKMLALTFDDGPNASTTPLLLDALKERNIKATFFMVGYNIENNPELVKRIYDEGHCIGNHTYDHVKLTTTDNISAKEQYTKVEDLLKSIIGQGSDLFRPPYGSYNNTVISFVNTPIALWNVDPRDWESRNTSAVYNHIIENAADGNIILLHDLYSTSVEAAIKAIDKLSADGYQFVTVEELMKRNGTTPEKGTLLYNITYNNN